MAKSVHNDVLDAALNEIATATIMTACDTLPTNRTEAVTTYALADVVMAGGDFTNSDGTTSGRKVTVAQKSGVTVDSTGDAINIALCDATNLLYVTECTLQTLTSGNTVTFNSWDVEIADPT